MRCRVGFSFIFSLLHFQCPQPIARRLHPAALIRRPNCRATRIDQTDCVQMHVRKQQESKSRHVEKLLSRPTILPMVQILELAENVHVSDAG